MRFAGKVIVVTGASCGTGRQAALDFAKQGAGKLVLVVRSKQKLSELASEISNASRGCTVVAYACKVSNKARVMKMVLESLSALAAWTCW